ncbi:MAG: glycosyltransferase family 4 protein [Patescibacteria group bacterium]|nr:glycosyltransferase family 4 protein [Patescibacteria group bacterium]
MKIIFATGIFPPDIGGPATYVEKLANELLQKGFEISVITFSDTKTKKNYDFPVIRISSKYPKGIKHFIYFLELLKMARGTDIIYVQNQTSAGLPSVLVSKLLKKRLILKVVGDAAWESYANRVSEFDNIETFQEKKYDFLTELIRKTRSFVAKNADTIITPSQYLKNIVKGWGVPEQNIQAIYNALEQLFEPHISKEEIKKKIGIKGDIILSIGRLTPWKGFSALIDIFPELLKENPDFKLIIVGEGEEKKKLELRVEKLRLKDNVKLVGKISHQDIPLYFRAADIFVLNSGYEGLPHVVLEAMQFGVPVVISNKGGNPELIKDSFNGFLIEYNNEEQIKNTLLKLWQDTSLQKKFIENSKEKLKEFSWENLVNKTIKLLTNK